MFILFLFFNSPFSSLFIHPCLILLIYLLKEADRQCQHNRELNWIEKQQTNGLSIIHGSLVIMLHYSKLPCINLWGIGGKWMVNRIKTANLSPYLSVEEEKARPFTVT